MTFNNNVSSDTHMHTCNVLNIHVYHVCGTHTFYQPYSVKMEQFVKIEVARSKAPSSGFGVIKKTTKRCFLKRSGNMFF
jgi:hypothetical protein